MPVRQVKFDARCKICNSPARAEIEELIDRRVRGEKADDGSRITVKTIVEAMKTWGFENPNDDNVKLHTKNHIEIVDTEAEAAIDEAIQTTIAMLNDGSSFADVDQSLRRLFTIGMAEMEAKITAGQKSGIGPDLLVKISDAITRRKQSDAQSELLRMVGGGIAAAIESRQVAQITTGDEIEAVETEFTEVPA